MKKINQEFYVAIKLCEKLDIITKELIGGVIVYFPTWKEFASTLTHKPPGDSVRIARYKKLKKFFRSQHKSKDGAGRYQFWQDGTFTMTINENRLRSVRRISEYEAWNGSEDAMLRRVPGSYGTKR